jgi:sorbitol-specific phosphotransferase system component IIBC
MLPLLTGAAVKMLGPSGSTTAKNKKISKEKLLGSSDLKDGKESVEVTKKSVKLLPPAPKLLLPESTLKKDDISSKSPNKISLETLKEKGNYISKILDDIIKYFKSKKKNTQKEIQDEKKNDELETKRKREEDLEKKPTKDKKISMPSVPGMSFLDRIINFFTSILIGSLLVFLLKNSNKIFKILDDISKGITNIWDVIRLGIISLSVTANGAIKNIAKLGNAIFKGPAKLTGNLIKTLGSSIKNVFKGVGKFVVNNIKRIANVATGATPGTRVGGTKRVDPSKTKKPPTPSKPVKPGTPKQTNPSVLNKAKNLFSDKGSKHLGKVSKIFKKIPFIGALIGIGIDMAMGERLDNAIAGAAGASLGAAIGGAIGTFALPIPGLGSFLGGMIGAAIGDWAGKEIYKKLSGQINEINPPQSDLLEPTDGGYSERLQRRLDSPLPYDAPPAGSVPAGRLSITQLVSLAKSVGFPDNEAAIMASIAMGESGGNSNAHNDNPKTGDDSYGLWQINMIDTLGPDRRKKLGLTSNDQLKDPVTNARAARLVRNESGLSAWTVYKKGIYKKYLPDAQKALKNAPTIPRDPAPDLSKAPPAPVLPSREQLDASEGKVSQQQGQIASNQVTRSSEGLSQQTSYEQQSSPVIIMGGGGSQPSGGSYGTGGVVPLSMGMSKQALLNSYYQTQLIGFLYKQG